MIPESLNVSWIAMQIATKVIVTLALIMLSVAAYRLALHPLACIPGPRAAAVSSIWLARHVRDGRMLELGKSLHKKYGHAVRVGPDEVWFDSKEAFRLVYGTGNSYTKSDFYLATKLNKPTMDWHFNLQWPDTLDFLSEFDTKRYRLQRRLIGPTYQISNLRKFEKAIDEVIGHAIAKLEALDGEEVDLKEWMHIIAVECLGAVVLSWSPGYIRDGTDGGTSTQGYISWRRKSVMGLFPLITKATFFSKAVGRLFSNVWGLTFSTPRNFKTFFTPVYQKSAKRITAALRDGKGSKAPPKDSRADLLADLIQLHKDRPEFSTTYLRRMAATNFGAGHETMCSALTSIMAMVGSHAGVASRIREEVLSIPSLDAAYVSYDEALRLPYTISCIKEAQRLHPVIGMSLARKTPAEGLEVHGYRIPPDTTVGCNPIALHRNQEIFGSNADDYMPERWATEGEDVSPRPLERYSLTWGGGARVCPGRHLAEMVLYKVVPSLIRRFDMELVTMPKEQEIRYYFMAMLTGVRVKFTPVRAGASHPEEDGR